MRWSDCERFGMARIPFGKHNSYCMVGSFLQFVIVTLICAGARLSLFPFTSALHTDPHTRRISVALECRQPFYHLPLSSSFPWHSHFLVSFCSVIYSTNWMLLGFAWLRYGYCSSMCAGSSLPTTMVICMQDDGASELSVRRSISDDRHSLSKRCALPRASILYFRKPAR